MPDVFLSYNRGDQATARRFAEAFAAEGLDVWWDTTLRAGEAYDEVTEKALKSAKAVVVLWSKRSVESRWVRAEATLADRNKTLMPAMIEPCERPIMFELTQTAELSHWEGDADDAAWQAFLSDVKRSVGARGGEGDVRPVVLASPPEPVAPASEPLLAVLAFDNLSGDPEMAYFSDGVSEEIQQTVARGADLRVIGRASSFQFRGADKAAAHVGHALGATHVLDGSVRRAGQRVRIAAQLIECRTETSRWSERYDRDLTDIFALQDEIAAAVAAALKTTFARSSAPSIDPAAYDLFLRALTLGETDFDSQRKRLEMLAGVVARAPGFARAWALLARDRAVALAYHGQQHAAAGLTAAQAAEAAQTALRLDPHMGVAYQALAFVEPWAAYGAREALHDKAMAASPNDVIVHATYRLFCAAVGRLRQALAVVRRAYELDPLSTGAVVGLGVQLFAAGQVDEGARVTEAALERWPENATLAHNAVFFAALRGDPARLEAVVGAHPEAVPTARLEIFRALATPSRATNMALLERLCEELAQTGTVVLDLPVFFLYAQGFADEIFEVLQAASFESLQRDSATPFGILHPGVLFMPLFDLPGDPRFVRLCAKLGLVSYWLDTDQWPDCADEVPYDFRAEARKLAAEGLARHA